jgi:hypothetical protein
MNRWQGKKGVSVFGTKQPVAIVIASPTGKRAFRVSGEEVPLEQLVREIPGIEKTIQSRFPSDTPPTTDFAV